MISTDIKTKKRTGQIPVRLYLCPNSVRHQLRRQAHQLLSGERGLVQRVVPAVKPRLGGLPAPEHIYVVGFYLSVVSMSSFYYLYAEEPSFLQGEKNFPELYSKTTGYDSTTL